MHFHKQQFSNPNKKIIPKMNQDTPKVMFLRE